MTTKNLIHGSEQNEEKVKSENFGSNAQDEIQDCGLSEMAKSLAKKELNEDNLLRERSLLKLRNLLQQHQDLENIRLDDNFLLRFLRVKKFNIGHAEQTVLKYLNLRRTFPHMTFNLDFLSPIQNALITNGYIFVSPVRDKYGRRVIIVQAKYFNAKIYSSADQAKAHILTFETLLEDPENQVMGLVHIGDFAGTTISCVTNWHPAEFAKLIKWGEQSFPIRHKGVHLVNCPSTVKWIVDFAKGRLSAKMKDRIYAYTNYKDMRKNIDVQCLPLELGGKIPMKDMIESWKLELGRKRENLLALDEMKLLSDKCIISSRVRNSNSGPEQRKSNYGQEKNNSKNKTDSNAGNFRKLELD